MMLRHMELHSHAKNVETAVLETIKEGKVRNVETIHMEFLLTITSHCQAVGEENAENHMYFVLM